MLSLNLPGEFRLIAAEAFEFRLADEPSLGILDDSVGVVGNAGYRKVPSVQSTLGIVL
jgi:hypothetical protein